MLPILETAEAAETTETASQPEVPVESPLEEPLASTTEVIPPDSVPAPVLSTEPLPEPVAQVEENTPKAPDLEAQRITDDITREPFATAEPIPPAPQAFLPSFLQDTLINPLDRLPNALIPTTLSLTILDVPPEQLITEVPSLDRILEQAIAIVPTPGDRNRPQQISLLLETLMDPTLQPGVTTGTLEARRPVAPEPLATAEPIPTSPQALLTTGAEVPTLPDRLIPTQLSLLIFNAQSEQLLTDVPTLNSVMQLSLAPNINAPLGNTAQNLSWLLTLLPSETLAPIALLPLEQTIALLPPQLMPQDQNLQARAQVDRGRNDRRLNAALRFLLSQDQTALESILEASGLQEPPAELQGQIIDFDRL